MTFLDTLAQQRWDDHRFYHHDRINQSLHFVSALGFLVAYALMFTEPAIAVLIGWLFSMPTRQAGHFFFEPTDYDHANQASHAHKEAIKVGYNLRRKIILLTIWITSPLLLVADPSAFGLMTPHVSAWEFADNVAMIWLAVGAGALIGRSVQLWIQRDAVTGLAWCAKILTDPFHDVMLYHRAPLHLLRGERYDPIVTGAEASHGNPLGTA